MIITSRDNQTIKEIIKLKDKKFRENSYLVEGIKQVREAIKENAKIEKIVISEDFENKDAFKDFECIEVSTKIFRDMTDTKTPQGVLAVVAKNKNKEIDYSKDFLIILDNIQDPGNLGTIIRTADSCDLGQVIVSTDTVDSYSPKVIRSTMGSSFRINVIERNLVETIKEIKAHGFEIIVTSLQTDKSIYDVDYSKKAIIIGNEAKGVRDEIMNEADLKVKIPMLGKTESLNASIAAGVMMYEYSRQKITKM